MYRTAIAVADGTRARLFTYGRARDPAGPHEGLAEVAALSARPRGGDPQVEFARSIGRVIDDLLDQAGIARLVLCASPSMLRALHDVLRPRHDVVVEDFASTLVNLTPPELVAALVDAGATYYSDEYAVLDAAGRVWPFTRPLSLRTHKGDPGRRLELDELGRVGEAPLPVGAIWLTKYVAGTRARPDAPSPGRAVLRILEHTLTARQRPQAALATLAAAARRAKLFSGPRGSARAAARWLLDEVTA